jgi:hypothetical protein
MFCFQCEQTAGGTVCMVVSAPMRDNERSHCSKPFLTRSAFFKKYSPCLKVYTDGFVIQ